MAPVFYICPNHFCATALSPGHHVQLLTRHLHWPLIWGNIHQKQIISFSPNHFHLIQFFRDNCGKAAEWCKQEQHGGRECLSWSALSVGLQGLWRRDGECSAQHAQALWRWLISKTAQTSDMVSTHPIFFFNVYRGTYHTTEENKTKIDQQIDSYPENLKKIKLSNFYTYVMYKCIVCVHICNAFQLTICTIDYTI